MAERIATIINGAIHLAGGQVLVPCTRIESTYIEITGGVRRSRNALELPLAKSYSTEPSDRDIHTAEWNPNMNKYDVSGF